MSCFAINCSKRLVLSYEKKFRVSAVDVKRLHEVTERICVEKIDSFV